MPGRSQAFPHMFSDAQDQSRGKSSLLIFQMSNSRQERVSEILLFCKTKEKQSWGYTEGLDPQY